VKIISLKSLIIKIGKIPFGYIQNYCLAHYCSVKPASQQRSLSFTADMARCFHSSYSCHLQARKWRLVLQVTLLLQHNATEASFYLMGTLYWRNRTHAWLAGIAQTELQLATRWMGGGQIFRTKPDRPWGLPSGVPRIFFSGGFNKFS
jgi:hypothetical protein